MMNYFNIFTNLFYLTLIVVLIVDLSGFIDSIKTLVKKILNIKSNIRLKPFDCSFCMTHWVGLIFIIVTHSFSLSTYALVLLFAFLASTFADLLILLKDILQTIINKLQNKL